MRYSIKTAIACTRGARSATARAGVRHSKNDIVWALLVAARASLNAAEAHLLKARTAALAARSLKARRAA